MRIDKDRELLIEAIIKHLPANRDKMPPEVRLEKKPFEGAATMVFAADSNGQKTLGDVCPVSGETSKFRACAHKDDRYFPIKGHFPSHEAAVSAIRKFHNPSPAPAPEKPQMSAPAPSIHSLLDTKFEMPHDSAIRDPEFHRGIQIGQNAMSPEHRQALEIDASKQIDLHSAKHHELVKKAKKLAPEDVDLHTKDRIRHHSSMASKFSSIAAGIRHVRYTNNE